jgi:hypothetical protein
MDCFIASPLTGECFADRRDEHCISAQALKYCTAALAPSPKLAKLYATAHRRLIDVQTCTQIGLNQ